MKNEVGPAILDRARTLVSFDLPIPTQCAEWWSVHARQLRTRPLRLAVLGWLTWSAGLSLRGMWSIAEKMANRDANVGEPEFRDYVAEINAHRRHEIPSALEMVKSSYRWTWTLHNIVRLLDRVRQNAPRARL